MEHILKSRLKKLTELYVHGVELCKKDEIVFTDMVKLRIALKLTLNNFKSDILNYTGMQVNEQLLKECIDMQNKSEELFIEAETLNELYLNKKKDETHQVTTKLPVLQMPKFSGNILEFSEFYDRFESAVGSKDLNHADKLAYLMNCLEGAALDVLKGLPTTKANYSVALDILKKQYGNKTNEIDAHYEALNNLKKAGNTAMDCRLTLSNIQRHLRVLNTLGENTDGNHIRVILRSKFPGKILYELSVLKGNNCSSMETLDGLERIITAMENASHLENKNQPGCSTEAFHVHTPTTTNLDRQGNIQHSFNSRKHKLPPSATAKKEIWKKSRSSCVFCNGDHYNDKCDIVTTVEDRQKKLKNKCFSCFKEGHFTKNCPMEIKCYHCKARHNSALCLKEHGKELNFSNVFTDKNVTYSFNISNKSFLQTATARVHTHRRNSSDCRLLLDCGSQRSYITSGLANKLGLRIDSEDFLMIYTFGSEIPKQITCPASEIEIESKRGIKKKIKVNIVPFITTKIAASEIPQSDKYNIDIIADDGSAGEQVDLLIGNDYYFSFIKGKIVLEGDLFLINTDFGWMLSGCSKNEREEDHILSVVTFGQCHRPDCPCFTEPDLPLRSIDVKFLWSLEGIGITDSPKTSREEEAVKHFNNTVNTKNRRYEVKWPWIQYPPELPTNFGLAFGRLKGLLKRLDTDTINEYDSILKEQLKAEVIEEIKKPQNPYQQVTPPIHYLPHHMVKQEGKRGRLVYDASSKLKDKKSLNECLYRGPSMLEDLTALLMTFRTNKIGITADVEKAFLQIGLQEEDREVTRFLWIKEIDKEPTDDNIIHLRFTRVPFGIISSPFLLTASIRHHMSQKNSNLLKEVADKCYVDNLVTGAQTIDEAIELFNRTNDVFEELSMNIREWTSNDKEFIQTIPSHKQTKEAKEVKVLGLTWNLEKDTLHLKYKEYAHKENPRTRKEVLKTLARIYDPCGFVAPLILSAKIMFQELCRRKLKWDDNIPEDLLQTWENIIHNLRMIKNIEIPRYLGMEKNTKLELHCFTDASKDAYAAVVYLRNNGANPKSTAFIMAKSRVTPVEEKDALKIPKLELLGCLIGCRLLKYVKDSLAIPIDKQYLWSDSLIVLSWMRSDKLLPPFVARRIDEIKKHNDIQSYYINTKENPADLATRPDLWLKKTDLWFNGPKFLAKEDSNWPETRSLDYHRSLLVVGEGQDAHHSEPKEITADDDHHEDGSQEINMEDVSKEARSSGQLAEMKKLQKHYFPEEAIGKETHLTRNLGLFLDVDGILRCKGRMSNTCWTYDMKHPILIPKECDFTNNLIEATHKKNYHVGSAHTLSLIRRQYWIPKGRAQVKKVISKCPQCQIHATGPYKLPPPPALPSERVNYSSPFTYTGVDYLGPIFVNTGTDKVKRWICLFTCLAVRAVHLEVTQDLTAEECLLALRRFISCRQVPEVVVSDNGTQFKLTSELFSNAYCIENKITWKFIPQLAPWHGGFYERLVALVKNCLKRTLEKRMLKDSQLVTVVKEVEAVINTRPLTNVGSELETVLRPSDFLSLGKCLVTEMSDKEFSEDVTLTKRNLVEGWKKGQIMIEEFKQMFVNQYLLSLRERYNHSHKQPRITSSRSPCIGDIVQVKGDTKNRITWKIGKIIELLKGSDGQCRVAKLKIGDCIYTRSVGHLYPLEVQDIPATCTEDKELHEDILNSRKNVVGCNSPMETQLPQNMPIEQISDNIPVEQISDNMPVEQTSKDMPVAQTSQIIPIAETPEQTPEESVTPGKVERIDIVDETHQDDTRTGEDRVLRGAAVRARERIAEWTRHLVALL